MHWDCPSGIRHVGGAKLNLALVRNVRTWPAMPPWRALLLLPFRVRPHLRQIDRQLGVHLRHSPRPRSTDNPGTDPSRAILLYKQTILREIAASLSMPIHSMAWRFLSGAQMNEVIAKRWR